MNKIEAISKASNLVRMHKEIADTVNSLNNNNDLRSLSFAPRQLLDKTGPQINIPAYASLLVHNQVIKTLTELRDSLYQEITAIEITIPCS